MNLLYQAALLSSLNSSHVIANPVLPGSFLVPPDEKVPIFPIVKQAWGARGYARVEIDESGIAWLEMSVDASANQEVAYDATVIISGYKDGEINRVLQPRIVTQSLTVGGGVFHGADKSDSWHLLTLNPEDIYSIRHVRLFLERDEDHPSLAEYAIDVMRQAGDFWDEADSLYRKVKESELAQDIAVALRGA